MNRERAKEKLIYSPVTGEFHWLVGAGNAVKEGDKAGSINGQGYVQIKIDGAVYLAHRLAWLMMNGEFPENQMDHINRNRSDNRWINLRQATVRENHANTVCNNEFVGVSFHKIRQKWGAYFYSNKKLKNLGYFKTHLAACYARHQEEINYES